MSFPRYPVYKDSGVEWLGQVPWHWNVKRLRYVTNIRKGKLPAETNQSQLASDDLPYLSMEFLRGDTDTPHYVPKSPSLLCVEDGDVLLLWDGSNAGEFLRAKRGVVSSTIAHLSGINVDRDFLFYACKAIQRGLKEQTIGMGIPHVSGDELRSRSIACPKMVEQTQIAAFLDCETAKIDAMVAEQRRLMALLKEKRQAVISHAVTRGLNPDAPMKPSGIEWLGDVPAHWEVTKFKRLTTSFEQGWSPQCEGYPVETELEWGVLKVGCVNGGTFRPEENKTLPPELEPLPSLGISTGDLLISRANTRELVGSAAVAHRDYSNLLLCDKLYRLRFQRDVFSPIFAALYLGTGMARGQIELAATGASSSMVNITQSIILELELALPDFQEQQVIVKFLDAELAKFDTLTTEAQRAIDLLQEHRTVLISAAVTGQIKVTSE